MIRRASFVALAAALIATSLVAAAPAAAVGIKPSQIVAFGDSLVDAGNIFLATGGYAPTNIYNNPSRGYFPGRFTNGPDYTDLLNQRLYGSYLTPSLAGGSNYAYGGARIVTDLDPVPDLTAQLATYFTRSGNSADANALYIINAGGNDVFGLQSGSYGAYPDAASYRTALLDTLAGGIQALSTRGATRILVTGIPNLTATGIALDAQVQARLDAIEPGLAGTQLLRFSYLNFFAAVGANPAAFGIGPFTQPGNCRDSRTVVNGQIDCTGFFSFDGTHPTAEVQRAIFGQVLGITNLASVPEPASWTLLIGGFAAVGTMMRRRVAIAARA